MSAPPTLIATVVLLAWPLIGLWLFTTRPPAQALLWTVLGGFLLLPSGAAVTFEGLPNFDKSASIAVAVLVGYLASGLRPSFGGRPGLMGILIVLYVVGPVVTGYLNASPVIAGGRVLPGTGIYDGISSAVTQSLALIPFFLGRQILREKEDGERVLQVLVAATLLYSLPMLFEVRMSPQLHNWIYGFFQSSFVTESRYGGFRPVVFLPNGLVLAIVVTSAIIAATALWRTRGRVFGLPSALPPAYLAGVLLLCKTLGALVIAVALAPLVRFARPPVQVRVAVLLVAITLAYPMLRTADFFPTAGMIELAAMVNSDRAGSLKTRFDQEEMLLDRASERFWFGWGRYGRGRVYDEYGKDVSLTDGQWIIAMGTFGFVGFIATFGLMAVPVFRSLRSVRFAGSDREAIQFAALAVIMAAILVDQLPNSSLSPWTWLLAGALLGRAEALRASRAPNLRESASASDEPIRPGYSRPQAASRRLPSGPSTPARPQMSRP